MRAGWTGRTVPEAAGWWTHIGRRVVYLVGVLLVVGMGSVLSAAPDAHAQGQTYTVATDTTFAPFEFQDKEGNFVGIDMDLIRAIAKDQGFTVDIKPLGFDAALQAVQANQVDGVIAGMSITDERKKVFDFSDPYFESGIQMAVLKSNNDIKSYEDLKGKRVAVKNGTQGSDFANSIKDKYGFEVVSFADSSSMFDEVRTGNSDAVFEDYPVLLYGIAQGNGFKTVTPKEDPTGYGFAVNKGQNPELLTKFNEGLKNLKAPANTTRSSAPTSGKRPPPTTTRSSADQEHLPAAARGPQDDRHPDGRLDLLRADPRRHLRAVPGVAGHLAARHRHHIRRHLPRHPASGAGVLHLLRHPVGARIPDVRAHRRHHHAVAERGRLHDRDRPRRHPVGRQGADGAARSLGIGYLPRCAK